MTTPATHAASHEDSIAAAKLFIKGLEFELAKTLEPIAASPPPNMDDSDAEDGAEGRWFSLERALDLIVGVSYLLGVYARQRWADLFRLHSSPTATDSA